MEDAAQTLEIRLKKLKTTVKRRIKTGKKYLLKATLHLENCQAWAFEHHRAELLQANLYQISPNTRTINVSDWETQDIVTIPLNPLLKPHEDVAKRFKKAKKLKLGLPYAENEYEKAQNTLKFLEEALLALETCDSLATFSEILSKYKLSEVQETALQIKKSPSKPYWEYLSSSGVPIWVGKNAAMNDVMTFTHAAGNNPWLHVADFPGSHVIIRGSQGQRIDEDTLQDALQLAIYHSKAKMQSTAEVSFTHVKYVRRFGKEKGQVQIAQEKRFFVRQDSARLKKLLRKS